MADLKELKPRLINLAVFGRFFRSGKISGFILIFCVIASLIIANTGLGDGFEKLLLTEIGYENLNVHLKYSISYWINDGLMAVFFLLVGLEIKRELIEGELSTVKQATLPIFAAIGGMLVPAAIYALFNIGEITAAGWGIPMATDIAFAIAIISLLGDRVPTSLRIFLTALAIVDDLGAIVVIAVFYTEDLNFGYLPYIIGLLISLGVLHYFRVKQIWLYLIPGALLWYFMHGFGIHATIAGVVTAFFLPTNNVAAESPLERLEHILTKPVNLLIMPIFALANTNITFQSEMINGLYSPLGMGIIGGLIVGKTLGISAFSYLSVRLKISQLPENTHWPQIIGLAMLGGIGFTMSIFIALLSFKNPEYQTEAKFAILVASVISGVAGYMFLNFTGKKYHVAG